MIKKTLISALAAVVISGSVAPAVQATEPFSVILTLGTWLVRNYVPVYQIQVKGVGQDENQAREQAFRAAVEQAIGSLVTSETKLRSGSPIEHEIISYSSGFIHDFEIVSRAKTADGVELIVNVWVERSSIADRLLDRSEGDTKIPGATIDLRYQTLLFEREQGDRLLKQVLGDYPHRAFKVELYNVETRIDPKRNLELSVDVNLLMSARYLSALSEVMRQTSTHQDIAGCFNHPTKCGHSHLVRIKYHPGGFFEKREFLGFDDEFKAQILNTAFRSVNPAMQVRVVDSVGNTIWSECFLQDSLSQTNYMPARRFVHWDENRTLIDGALEIRTTMKMMVPNNHAGAISKLEVSVIPLSECRAVTK